MDPEVALASFRSAIRAYHEANKAKDTARLMAAASVLVAAAEALDGWLCHGGALPRAWER